MPGSKRAAAVSPSVAIDDGSVGVNVSEEVWAKAIHAVKVQKMSLRQAAQVYGVHHMSLHRRVRGRYATSVATSFDIRAFLSEDDEAEVLGVLREQFLHEKRITSDDIRFVVRAIASHGGKLAVPPEFPPGRWIADFKRAHGFTKLNSFAYPLPTPTPPVGTAVSGSPSSMSDGDMDDGDSEGSGGGGSGPAYPRYVVSSFARRPPHLQHSGQYQQQEHDRRPSDREQLQHWGQNSDGDHEDFGSTRSSRSFDNATTTGSSCGSFEYGEAAAGGGSTTNSSGDTATAPASHHQQQQEPQERSYKLSHTVPPETWEKAIAAVEQQGMSLRTAARAYGVHFAALHRRVKKRAQGDATAPGTPLEGYFHPDDEAGIIRVVVARAELGVLMTFDELMDLVQRAALRNLPDISVDAARKLMARFQSRNEHAIRHIIVDWPLPRISSINLNGSSHGKSRGRAVSSSAMPLATAGGSRAVRGPSRPAVIVTNTSALRPNMGGKRPLVAPPAAPLRGELPPAQTLLLRGQQQHQLAPQPATTPQNVRRASSSSSDGSEKRFVQPPSL